MARQTPVPAPVSVQATGPIRKLGDTSLPPSTSSIEPQTGFDVFHEQEKAKRIRRRPLKTEALIEACRRLVLGVDHDGATTNDVGCLNGAHQRILQQTPAKSLALFG